MAVTTNSYTVEDCRSGLPPGILIPIPVLPKQVVTTAGKRIHEGFETDGNYPVYPWIHHATFRTRWRIINGTTVVYPQGLTGAGGATPVPALVNHGRVA